MAGNPIRALGYLLAIVLTLGSVFWLCPLIYNKSPTALVGLAALVVVIPALIALQTFLMGDRKFSLVEFGKIYLSEYVDLSLEMLFIALFLPVALFDLLGWVFGFVMLIGAITTVIFGLQKLGVQTETAQGADPNAFLISLTILVGSTALGVGYWFLHQWTKNLEESLYAHLRDKFENIKALFTY